jgi:2-haloalkanoic acid dehalogenase type II
MGTCLDWHSSITPALSDALFETAYISSTQSPTDAEVSNLALAWREGFFKEIHARFQAGLPQEDIDDTHRRVLKELLDDRRWKQYGAMSDEWLETCVQAWHDQEAWPDVHVALPKLRREFDVVVLANGTTRLQVDITKSAGLSFDMLLSSELLGLTKPDPAIYRRAMELLRTEPSECLMVAAHAYDLRAAKRVGMRTCYLRRWTEDLEENFGGVEEENDWFVDCREATAERGGLGRVAELFRGV